MFSSKHGLYKPPQATPVWLIFNESGIVQIASSKLDGIARIGNRHEGHEGMAQTTSSNLGETARLGKTEEADEC